MNLLLVLPCLYLPVIGTKLAFCNLLICVVNLLPLPSSDLESGTSETPNMMDFVTGWDQGSSFANDHGRATAVGFAADGRLYIGDDTKGEIVWVAPIGLMRP